ncbi:mediator of RNA polymerase II transcription subunit 1-like [Salarias fasciatus]|uniref:mediator of RNA polymerase II transcription subunit 1-like n=1 Tax=Salarias fasciatus TaxID=181472 RepID=UPI00117704CB|nr:mediator of RNA polymerase II transcription subunit 1-like [Salarias fasciatus]
MTPYFVKKLMEITGVAIPESNLQWAPLPKLLPLPGGVMHSYALSEASWDLPAHRGAVVEHVPFTSPAQVAALLDVLRHQCFINTLLRSCFTVQTSYEDSLCDLSFEVLPESDVGFSVTFQHPNMNSLAVLLVNVCNHHQITCRLYGAAVSESSIDEDISTVVKSCMSIPDTIKILYGTLQDIASFPLSPGLPVATQAEAGCFAPWSVAAAGTSDGPATFSQDAAGSADYFAGSASDFVTPASTPHSTSTAFPELIRALLQPRASSSCRPAPQNDGQ